MFWKMPNDDLNKLKREARAGLAFVWLKASPLLRLSKTNFVKISEVEVEILTDISDLEEAKNRLWHDKLQQLVITRGSNGCLYFTSKHSGEVDSFKIRAIDTNS
jgi:sugar/nucleoside kinase (ribokinase family)